jgi:hypothetical protein
LVGAGTGVGDAPIVALLVLPPPPKISSSSSLPAKGEPSGGEGVLRAYEGCGGERYDAPKDAPAEDERRLEEL